MNWSALSPEVRLNAAAHRIGSILDIYIKIHNEVFRFSLRRILPFPIFFEKMDFALYSNHLTSLREAINETIIQIPGEDSPRHELSETLLSYSLALDTTIALLLKITENLNKRCRDKKLYTWKQYAEDVKIYNESVTDYQSIGFRLNGLL
jgi:hypothetical protein